MSTFQVVLVPTLVGVIANEFFHDVVKKFTAWLPLVGVAITTLLCASPCAQVATVLRCVFLPMLDSVSSAVADSATDSAATLEMTVKAYLTLLLCPCTGHSCSALCCLTGDACQHRL